MPSGSRKSAGKSSRLLLSQTRTHKGRPEMTVSYRLALLALVLSPTAALAEVRADRRLRLSQSLGACVSRRHPQSRPPTKTCAKPSPALAGRRILSTPAGLRLQKAKTHTGTQPAANGCRERWRAGNDSERQSTSCHPVSAGWPPASEAKTQTETLRRANV
jgi:hypothetical protein